jgi:chemotaxis-related protein WspD
VDSANPNPNQALTTAGDRPATALAQPAFDCWNQIGVTGDGSCVELARLIHCRNCPVYAAAGARMLDRAAPADYRRHWTEQVARQKERFKPGKISVVIFRVGPAWLALSTLAFQEVAEKRRIHSLPHRRHGSLLGVTNVRGELLVCISLGRLLGDERQSRVEKPRLAYDRLVVAEWQGSRMTFPVDEIHGVHRCHPEEIEDVPATLARASVNFTRGLLPWQGRKVGCLDVETVFSAMNRSLA